MAKAKFAILLCGLALALGWVNSLRASESDSTQASYIVLIGISEYNDPQIKPRPHAEADIKALYDVFINPKYLGAPASHVKLLLGKKDEKRPSELATHNNILDAVKWATSKAKRDDLVIFAFIGQGAPLGNQGNTLAYLGTDVTLKERGKTAVAAADLAQEF